MTTEDDTTTTTEYRVRLDREGCEGIFACLVRDDRFVEAADGLATIDETDTAEEADEVDERGAMTATFVDDSIADARQAARACPVGAIDVLETGDE